MLQPITPYRLTRFPTFSLPGCSLQMLSALQKNLFLHYFGVLSDFFPAIASFFYLKRLDVYHSIANLHLQKTLIVLVTMLNCKPLPWEERKRKERSSHTSVVFAETPFTKRLKDMLQTFHLHAISVMVFKGIHYNM